MTNSAAAALSGDNSTGNAGADGSADAPWYGEGLNDTTVGLIQNKGWKGIDAMAESYSNLEKFAGGSKNVIALPGDDATPDDMAVFYGKLGRPETVEGYGLELPDGGDADLHKWFLETSHSNGLTTAQAKTMFEAYNEMAAGRIDAMETAATELAQKELNDVRKEWGQDFDKRVDAGKQAAKALGFDKDSLPSLEAEVGTATMMKLFAAIGDRMGEASFVDGDRGDGSSFGISAQQAQAQIADLKADQSFMGKYMAGDQASVQKMKRLMEAAYG